MIFFLQMNEYTHGSVILYKAGHRLPLRSCASEQLAATGRREHTGRLFVDYAALSIEQSLPFRSTRSAWTQHSMQLLQYCIQFHGNWRLSAGVEHALLEQLTFFRTQTLFSKTWTHTLSPLRRRVKAQIKRRQMHVNAGTVPATRNAGTLGRPVAGFR